MLWTRIGTAAVGIPLFLGLIWAGGLPFGMLAATLALLGFHEFARMWGQKGVRVPAAAGALACLLLVAAAQFRGAAGLVPALTLGALALVAGMALAYGRYSSQDLIIALGGVVYVGWLFAHFVLLRALPQGLYLILGAFLLTWASDTGAYFAGRAFGRRKLAPLVSPGKTVEGVAGGTALAAAVGFFLGQPLLGLPPAGGALLGILLAGAAVIGDLAESALKRHAGVKDSGALLPGHGGVLDRFDSALFTVPAAYYVMTLLAGR